jgi:hypothetical protein
LRPRTSATGCHRLLAGQQSVPAVGGLLLLVRAQCHADAHIGHLLHRPLEIVLGQRVDVHVRRGIGEVDRVWNAVLDGELDRIHVVAECLAQPACAVDDQSAFLGREEAMIDEVAVRPGCIRVELHHQDVGLAEHQAARVFFPGDVLLQHHALGAGLVIGTPELVDIVDFIDALEATAPGRLEDHREATDIGDMVLPRYRIFEVAQRLGMHDPFDIRV